eukprot:762550-Hanusia_phi.AAC.7
MGTTSTMRSMKVRDEQGPYSRTDIQQASSISSRGSMWIGAPVLRAPASNVANRRSAPLSNLNMGLFGLGWGELAVSSARCHCMNEEGGREGGREKRRESTDALRFRQLEGRGSGALLLRRSDDVLGVQAQTFSSAMQESLEEAEKGMNEAEMQVRAAAPR